MGERLCNRKSLVVNTLCGFQAETLYSLFYCLKSIALNLASKTNVFENHYHQKSSVSSFSIFYLFFLAHCEIAWASLFGTNNLSYFCIEESSSH